MRAGRPGQPHRAPQTAPHTSLHATPSDRARRWHARGAGGVSVTVRVVRPRRSAHAARGPHSCTRTARHAYTCAAPPHRCQSCDVRRFTSAQDVAHAQQSERVLTVSGCAFHACLPGRRLARPSAAEHPIGTTGAREPRAGHLSTLRQLLLSLSIATGWHRPRASSTLAFMPGRTAPRRRAAPSARPSPPAAAPSLAARRPRWRRPAAARHTRA